MASVARSQPVLGRVWRAQTGFRARLHPSHLDNLIEYEQRVPGLHVLIRSEAIDEALCKFHLPLGVQTAELFVTRASRRWPTIPAETDARETLAFVDLLVSLGRDRTTSVQSVLSYNGKTPSQLLVLIAR